MANYLDLDPDQLRVYAEQLERYAAAMRKWGEIPEDWLKEFPDGYGTIADPMHGALEEYYRKRHEKAEAQAASAERTAHDLRTAAGRMENTELSGGQQISNAGPHGGPSPVTHGPSALDGHTPKTPAISNDSPQRAPDIPARPVVSHTDGVTGPAAATPGQPGHGTIPAFAGANPVAPIDVSHSMPSPEHRVDGSAPPPTQVVPVRHSTPEGAGVFTVGYGTGTQSGAPIAAAVPLMGPTGPLSAVPAPQPPRPLRPGPLAVSFQPVRGHRQGLPQLVVGDGGEDDLTLARTLLSAVLFAVGDSAPGVEWATGVVRNRKGAVVLLTSTEGRGWLPAGLFVPSEVLIPWRWDSILDAEGRGAITAFENNADPARILTEFARHAARAKRGHLRALASTSGVGDYVRATLGSEVAIADLVVATETSVDLSSPGAGLFDRLDAGGSATSRQRAAEVADSDIRAVCVQLARDADALARQAMPDATPEVRAQRARRQEVLHSLGARDRVSASSRPHLPPAGQDLVAPASAVFAPSGSSRAAATSAIISSNFSPPPDVDTERSRMFERRADELISLLLTEKDDHRMLRDVLYVHDQIAEHPQLQSILGKVPAPTANTTSVDTGSAGPNLSPAAEYQSFPVSPGRYGEERSIR
ncbi:type VII secretion target [Nocardia mikamii]|uniref:type VII secretion target n=1 Tax=Nocardia mikamii TaxID=508464 RepID=UPI000A0522F0|nr:type VII secretion target [Nocardia mikamii]